MSSIDERVVQMRFENSQFEQGIQKTTQSLDNLKSSLNLKGAEQSLQNLNAEGKRFSLTSISDAFDEISTKVQIATGVVTIALANIANKAIEAGATMIKSLTLDPINAGFAEYELKMGSIQTILANTSKYGTTLKDVNTALDELNTYSDKTIYNFGAMTKNIGLFTNAGIKLEDAVSMIKGFSNAAAASGTTAENAAGAAYQLSQALSAGTVRLMDWRSLTNAGMGGANMKQGLVDLAGAMGTLGKNTSTSIMKDFNGSLQSGWLSADVMSKYLKIMAGDMTDAQMAALGLSQTQIIEFKKQQKTAEDAATKIRTYSQLVNTVREAVGSSWSETFGIIIGNFDEATDIFTGVNNAFSSMITASSDARNNLLKDWKKYGGRTAIIDGLTNAFKYLGQIVKTIGDAFSEVFPPTTARQLVDASKGFKTFIDKLKPSKETLEDLKRTLRGVFSIFGILWEIVKAAAKAFGELFGETTKGSSGFLKVTGNIGDFIYGLLQAIKAGDGLNAFFSGLVAFIKVPINIIKSFIAILGDIVTGVGKISSSLFGGITGKIEDRLNPMATTGKTITSVWDNIVNIFKTVMNFFQPLVDAITNMFNSLPDLITGAFKRISFNGVLDMINTGLLGGIVLLLSKIFKGGLFGSLFGNVNTLIGNLTSTMTTFQSSLKAKTLISLAIAIAIITASVVALSLLDSKKLTIALGALGAMFTELLTAFSFFTKFAGTKGLAKLQLVGVAMILLATAIGILTTSVMRLSKLSWEQLAVGLAGLAAILGAVIIFTGTLTTNVKGLITAGYALIILATGIKILASVVKTLAELSWEKLTKGLLGLGIILTQITIFNAFASANKSALGNAVALIILATAIKILASAVSQLGRMDIGVLTQGFIALGLIFTMVTIFSKLNAGAKSLIGASIGLILIATSMKIFASAIAQLGSLSWEQLAKGLIGMGVALGIITAALWLMPVNIVGTAIGLVLVATALVILANALTTMGNMSWEQLGKGLLVLATSLAILAGALYLMTGSLPGAAALLLAAMALSIMTPALIAMSKLSWEEVAKGLIFLAAGLAIIAGAGYLLIGALPGLLGLGAAALLVGVGTLLAGAGIFLLSMGIVALVGALTVGVALIIALVKSIIDLIPYLALKIGEGIITLVKVIADSSTVILAAVTVILMTLITALATVIPPLIKLIMDTIILILKTLQDNLPRIIKMGVNILVSLLEGIAKGLPKIIKAGADIVIAFLKAIGDEGPRIIDQGFKTIITFIKGVTKAIKENVGPLRDAAADLGWAIADGMTFGLAGHGKNFINNVINLGNDGVAALKDTLGIKSPSKVFAKLGMYSAMGLADGLYKNSGLVKTQAENVGTKAVNGLKNAISKISDVVLANIDVDPTIRPVLDLSSIKKDASLIDSMLTPSIISLDSAYAQASSIAVSQKNNQAQELTSAQDVITNSDTNITFIQNNNSPKALSAAEIYRQTKNQISAIKLTTAV